MSEASETDEQVRADVGPLRKFTCSEVDILEANGVSPSLVRHYPRGLSVHEIIEAESREERA